MSDLLKESLMRSTKKNMKSGGGGKISIKDKYHPLGRAIQIIEVSDWMNKKINIHTGNLASELCRNFNLPCVRFVTQMIRYGQLACIPVLRDQLGDGDISVTMLSTFVWIMCSSTFPQVLVLAFGLYDVHDEDYMDKEAATALLTDLLIDEEVQNDKGNEIVKVTEIADELFKYAEAKDVAVSPTQRRRSLVIGNESNIPHELLTLTIDPDSPGMDIPPAPADETPTNKRSSFPGNKPRSFALFPSTITRHASREVSVYRRTSAIFRRASNVFRRRSVVEESPFGVTSATFQKFFLKKKTGVLWQLQMLQDKLKEASFGIKAWTGVREWTVKHNFHGLDASSLRVRELLRSVGFELAKYLSMKSGRPLLTAPPPTVNNPARTSITESSNTFPSAAAASAANASDGPVYASTRPPANEDYKMGEHIDHRKGGLCKQDSERPEVPADSPEEEKQAELQKYGSGGSMGSKRGCDDERSDDIGDVDSNQNAISLRSETSSVGDKKKKKKGLLSTIMGAGRKIWS